MYARIYRFKVCIFVLLIEIECCVNCTLIVVKENEVIEIVILVEYQFESV